MATKTFTERAAYAALSVLLACTDQSAVVPRHMGDSIIAYPEEDFVASPLFLADTSARFCRSDSIDDCLLANPAFGVLDGASGAFVGEYMELIVHVDRITMATRTIGRLGVGPGEYRMVHAASVVEGGLRIFDFATRRVTQFLPDGSTATMWNLLDVPIGEVRLGSGSVYVLSVPGVDRMGHHVRGRLVKFAPQAGVVDTIADIRVRSYRMLNSDLTQPRPLFSPMPSWDVGLDDSVWLSSGEAYQIHRLSESGRLEFTIDVSLSPVAVSPLDVAHERDRILGPRRESPMRRSQEVALQRAGSAKFHAPITRITAMSAGGIWVRGAAGPSAPTARWTYFGEDGQLVGHLMLSTETQILDGNMPDLLVVTKDPLDMPYLSWLSLR